MTKWYEKSLEQQKLEKNEYNRKRYWVHKKEISDYHKEYNQKPEIKAKNKRKSRLRHLKFKSWAIEYLGGKCKRCGLVDKTCVYDFHHYDPTTKDVAFSLLLGHSFETMKIEIDKCILLCANCHRLVHYNKETDFVKEKANGDQENV